jgi:hypothetical protein
MKMKLSMNKRGEEDSASGFGTIGNILLILAGILVLLLILYFAAKSLFGIDISTMLPG